MPSMLKQTRRDRPGVASGASQFDQLKVRIHQQLVQRLDVQNLKSLPPDTVRAEVRIVIRELCQSESGLLTSQDQERLMDEVMDETFGLGPLEALLKDPTITDILVNRFDKIYVERRGRLEHTDVRFRDNQHLRQIIDRIVGLVGRRVDETSPMVDARLADGSRVNAIIPAAGAGRPGDEHSPLRFQAAATGRPDPPRRVSPPVMDFLSAAVQARCNVLISGGTGSGKTTLLNCLSRYIPSDERVVTIEDAAELQLQQPHVVRLETRPPNIEGRGRSHPARPGEELPAHASGPDHHRRSARRRGAGHAAGDEHRPRGFDDHGSRQHHARRAGPSGSDDRHGRIRHPDAGAAAPDRQRAADRRAGGALTGGKRKVTRVTEITGMEGDGIQAHDIFHVRADRRGFAGHRDRAL